MSDYVSMDSNECQAVRQLREAAWRASLLCNSAQGFADLREIRLVLVEALLSFQMNAHEAVKP